MATHPTFWSGGSASSALCSRGTSWPSSEVVLSSTLAQSPGPGTASPGLLGRRAANTRHVGIKALTVEGRVTQKGSLSLQTGRLSGEIKAWQCSVTKLSKHPREGPSGTLLDPQRKAQTFGVNRRPREHHGAPRSPCPGTPTPNSSLRFGGSRANLGLNGPLSGPTPSPNHPSQDKESATWEGSGLQGSGVQALLLSPKVPLPPRL